MSEASRDSARFLLLFLILILIFILHLHQVFLFPFLPKRPAQNHDEKDKEEAFDVHP